MHGRTLNLETACREFEEDLVLYYYGDGSAAERARVAQHIEGCPRCAQFLQDLRKLLPRIAEPTNLPQSFWDDYQGELGRKLAAQRDRQDSWWRAYLPVVRTWVVPAFGTAAVAIVAIALVFGKGNWEFNSGGSRTNIPQEILTDSKQLEFFSAMDMLESLNMLESLEGSQTDGASTHRS